MAVSTLGGLLKARYTSPGLAGMRFPSTLITWCSGSTRAPNRRTVCPSTSTRPAPISSSQCLRLPTPASARTFCSRTPPGTSVSESLSSSSYSSTSRSLSGVLILKVLNVLWQERREIGEILQARQAQPFQEVARGAVQDGSGLRVRASLLDQAAQRQRTHDAVAVDPADRRDPGPAHRLAVGDDRERLKRRLGEANLLAVSNETLDERGAILTGVEAPAAGYLAQVKATARGGVFLGEFGQRGRYLVPRVLEHLRKDHGRHGFVGHQQDGLQARPQPGARPGRFALLALLALLGLLGVMAVLGLRVGFAGHRRSVVAFGQLIVAISVLIVRAGPCHVELAQRGDLLEGDDVLLVQVKQGKERGHH